MILSGALDPSTPPAWAGEVARTLSGSTLVRFPARGHALQSTSTCAQSIARAFLAGQAVDASCAGKETVNFR